jgi:hypothetical protein
LFLSQLVRRIRQADLVRRLQELQGDAHLNWKTLCLEVIISSVRVRVRGGFLRRNFSGRNQQWRAELD